MRNFKMLQIAKPLTIYMFFQHNSVFLGRSASGPIGLPLFHFYVSQWAKTLLFFRKLNSWSTVTVATYQNFFLINF
jgi:hypothetical protein